MLTFAVIFRNLKMGTPDLNFTCSVLIAEHTDDLPLLYERLEDIKIFKEISVYNSITTLIQKSNEFPADAYVVYYDSIMGEDLLHLLPDPSKIILIGNHAMQALVAYEIGIRDFILKSYGKGRLIKAISRVLNQVEMSKPDEFVVIKSGRRQDKVLKAEIFYVEAFGNYVKVFCQDKMYLSLEKLGVFRSRVGSNMLIQCHKSFLVNPSKVQSCTNESIRMDNEVIIPVSQTFKNNVLASFYQKNEPTARLMHKVESVI